MHSTLGLETGTKPKAEFNEYLEEDAMDSKLLQREHILDGNSRSSEFGHTRNRLIGRSGSICSASPLEEEEDEQEITALFLLPFTQLDNVRTVLYFRNFFFEPNKHIPVMSPKLAFFMQVSL